MSNKLIDFINISKSYGTQTDLDDLNLYIRENEQGGKKMSRYSITH